MHKRSVAIPWRHLGWCVALLGGLMALQPGWAQGGTPNLSVYITPNKLIVAPNELIGYQMVILNSGTAAALNTRVKLVWIAHADYVPGSSTLNGAPIPDAPDGNPFLQGVAVGDLAPGQDVTLTFQLKVSSTIMLDCPVKVKALVLNDSSGPTPTPVISVPQTHGRPNLEYQKLVDSGTASPGQVITYRIVVNNTGNGTALDVRVQDKIPACTQYVPGSTQVNGKPVPDQLGGSPLEAGLAVGDIPAFSSPVTVTMQVMVNDQVPVGVIVRNTAYGGHEGPPDVPTNMVTTSVVPTPVPTTTTTMTVPNRVTTIVPPGVPVTGTPTDITVCDTGCAPTTADVHVSTDLTRGAENTWLEVTALDATGSASIDPSLGPGISDWLSRAGLVAPGVDTVFNATFPEPGDEVDVSLSLTPKALQLIMLDQIMKRIAMSAGAAPPTPRQVAALYAKVSQIPSLLQALEEFGPLSTLPPLPEAGDATSTPPPPGPLDADQLAFQFQLAEEDLSALLYSPNDMNTFREALQTVTGYPYSNANIRPVALTLSEGNDAQMAQLLNELSLVLPSRAHPIKLRFLAHFAP